MSFQVVDVIDTETRRAKVQSLVPGEKLLTNSENSHNASNFFLDELKSLDVLNNKIQLIFFAHKHTELCTVGTIILLYIQHLY